jgi:hypothetical protein
MSWVAGTSNIDAALDNESLSLYLQNLPQPDQAFNYRPPVDLGLFEMVRIRQLQLYTVPNPGLAPYHERGTTPHVRVGDVLHRELANDIFLLVMSILLSSDMFTIKPQFYYQTFPFATGTFGAMVMGVMESTRAGHAGVHALLAVNTPVRHPHDLAMRRAHTAQIVCWICSDLNSESGAQRIGDTRWYELILSYRRPPSNLSRASMLTRFLGVY